jgi:carbon monoxide dehydrogenase subunit G
MDSVSLVFLAGFHQLSRKAEVILEERFELAASPQAVWDFLIDPVALRRTLPGCEELETVDERTFRATAKVKLGFIQFRFRAKIRLGELEPPYALKAVAEGEDLGFAGSFKTIVEMRLRELSPGRTELAYRSQTSLLGRLAAFGSHFLEGKARQQAQEFIAAVRKEVEVPVAGAG